MSMNPARTLGSGLPPMIWSGLWIYFTAPPLGMLIAAEVYLWWKGKLAVRCASCITTTTSAAFFAEPTEASPDGSLFAGSDNAFAIAAGGGLDVNLTHHIALRAFEADYYLTRYTNGANTRQNNLRVYVGVIFRFGE